MTHAAEIASKERHTRSRRLADLEDNQRKLLQAHYSGAITIELLKEEQDRINREKTHAEQLLAAAEAEFVAIEDLLARAFTIAADCRAAYREAGPTVRRLFNQAFFERLYVDPHKITGADLAEPFAQLLEHDLMSRIHRELKTQNPDTYTRQGSNKVLLARPEGLEPPTF